MPTPGQLLLGASAVAVAYFGFIKPAQDRRKAAQDDSGTDSAKPLILFTEECGWTIPDAWYTEVGKPKLTQILQTATQGKSGEELHAAMQGVNSHETAHSVLTGETQGCELPPADAPMQSWPLGLSVGQRNMYELFAHMIGQVEATMVKFVNSDGTVIEFPVVQGA